MNHLKNIIGYLMIGLMFGILPLSCDQDPLDRDPVSSFTETTVFQDINLAKAYLGNCYDKIGGDPFQTLGLTSNSLCSATDECYCIHNPGQYTWSKGTMSPSYLGHFGNWRFIWLQWGALYDNIKNVNVLLANIDKVPAETSIEEELKSRIKAEAYFIRAFDYTNLMRSYGGLVLMDEPMKLRDDFSTLERSSLAETRDFILADIERAINGLPEKENIDQGRATKGAAAALKVRLLTFCASKLVNGGYEPNNPLVSFQEGTQQQRWEAARDAGREFINGTYGNYSLTGTTDDPPANMTKEQIMEYADNFHRIFLQKGAWNDDIIYGVQYNKEEGTAIMVNRWDGPNGYHNWGNDSPQEPFVRAFEMADGTRFDWDGPPSVTDEFVREATAAELEADPYLNPYYGREPRFYASILYHGAPWQERPSDVEAPDTIQSGYFVEAGADHTNEEAVTPGVDTRQGPTEPWNGTGTGYYLKKFLDPDIVGQYENNEQTWPEMRYAEVLLDYAEACIELGELQNGIDALNMVRNRAGLPDRPVTTQEEAMEFLRHERKIEFFGELIRWYDIRRWMIAGDVIQDVHKMNVYEWEDGKMRWEYDTETLVDERMWVDKCYWLPIEIEEMNRLPQLIQNPNY